MHRSKLTAPLLAIILVFVAINMPASAQNSGNINVNPVYQEVILKPKPDTQYSNFKITNNTVKAQTFNLRAVDFGSLNETGGVAFIGVNNPDTSYKYGLSLWIDLEEDSVTINPGKTAEVRIKISDIKSMSPGGHYGAILVEPQNNDGRQEEPKVAVSQVISSLILAKKIGGEVYKLDLESFEARHSALNLPSSVTLKFHNGGNVHLVPRGTVSLRDSKGGVISEGLINSGSGFVLPESNRQLITGLQERSSAWLPGKYYLDIKYRYDGNDKFQTKTEEVFYLGKITLLLPLVAVLIGVIIWRLRKRK